MTTPASNPNAAYAALSSLGEGLLSLIFPPQCLVCRSLDAAECLCAQCAATIAPVVAPICLLCGQTVQDSGCAHCKQRVPAFATGRSMGAYEGALRTSIHLLKYRSRPQLAEPLGKRLAAFAREEASALNGLAFQAVAPIPMTPARKRVRGYNQAERLAIVVARELQLPCRVDALSRTRSTRAQVGLTGDARRANLSGAFAASPCAGQSFLLIDDVTTTGSTLHEAAMALRAAGASAVYALTLAAG